MTALDMGLTVGDRLNLSSIPVTAQTYGGELWKARYTTGINNTNFSLYHVRAVITQIHTFESLLSIQLYMHSYDRQGNTLPADMTSLQISHNKPHIPSTKWTEFLGRIESYYPIEAVVESLHKI